MREHHHPATGHQSLPPEDMGNPQHLHMDPPLAVAHWIWSCWPQLGLGSRWPGWDFRPGSSGGGGTPLGSSQLGCGVPSCKRGESSILLNELSPRQEESHACRQCRLITQLFINVKCDLLLRYFLRWGGGSTLPCSSPGLLGPCP